MTRRPRPQLRAPPGDHRPRPDRGRAGAPRARHRRGQLSLSVRPARPAGLRGLGRLRVLARRRAPRTASAGRSATASRPRASSSRPAASGYEASPPRQRRRSAAPGSVPEPGCASLGRAAPCPAMPPSLGVSGRCCGASRWSTSSLLGALLFAASALRESAERETIVIDRATRRRARPAAGRDPGPPAVRAGAGAARPGRDRRRGAAARGVQARARAGRGGRAPSGPEDALHARRGGAGAERGRAARLLRRPTGERYRSPPTVTLDHVFYADPDAVPDGLLERLRAGADFRGLGDRLFMLGPTARPLQRRRSRRPARRRSRAPRLRAAAGRWQGPFRSAEGVALRPRRGAAPGARARVRGGRGLAAPGLAPRQAAGS